jgi:hypothetical protein
LTNTDDLTYTGPIYLGTNQVAGTVIYDTGSGWLTITSSECEDCLTKVYDPSLSSNAAL